MKFFRKNLNSNFIRICRIQCSSKQRPQMLYPDEWFSIKVKLDNIYSVDVPRDFKKYELDLYAGNDMLFLINTTDFYVKIHNEDGLDNKYIDIGMTIPTYSTNIHVDIETANQGAVTFYCDAANRENEGYSRLTFFSTTATNMLYKGGTFYRFIDWPNPTTLTVTRGFTKITEMRSNTVAFVHDTAIENGDNDKFKLEIDNSTDYGNTLKIKPTPETYNTYMLIEHYQ